ncbi:glycosyltransferase [Paraburkholderia sp. A2RI-6]|uniref:glycosyltransferase family 4 protein n=1 Tax=Paraburkholderia sp. A2RI-6 TaxID=3028371 RepID=UPI003B825F8D
MEKKIPYLVVLASSCQLYSGTGVALFEWIRFAKGYFEFSICIDNLTPLNYKIARDFCLAEGLRFFPCGPLQWAGGGDPGNAMVPLLVGSRKWPLIEFVSWANTNVNLAVLDACTSDVHLIYTPHTQPTWTIPHAKQLWALESAFDRMLSDSSLVCCDSPAEVETVLRRVPSARAAYIPIGTDTSHFRPGEAPRMPRLLVVADFNEARKRTDLSLSAIYRLLRRNPTYQVALAGRNSDKVEILPEFATRFECLGYISDTELLELYQRSSVFLLLSDYEAFGIPIVEALACGTPVVTTATREAISLFSELPGCYLVNNLVEIEVDAAIDAAIRQKQHENIARMASERFSLHAAYTLKLKAIQVLLPRQDFGCDGGIPQIVTADLPKQTVGMIPSTTEY